MSGALRWRTLAHFAADPLPPGWRDRLWQRLGERPRRLGIWAELALYGARFCLDDADEAVLSPAASLWVCSLSGPRSATRAVSEQTHAGLTMPFTFLQSQPSQLLAALGLYLQWTGDARFMVSRHHLAVRRLAELEAGAAGFLIGLVEEDLRTEWWRIAAEQNPAT